MDVEWRQMKSNMVMAGGEKNVSGQWLIRLMKHTSTVFKSNCHVNIGQKIGVVKMQWPLTVKDDQSVTEGMANVFGAVLG